MSIAENRTAPYLHWHVVCVSCSRITMARACHVSGPIEPIEHNPTVKCQHCGDLQQYLTAQCFLAPISGENVKSRAPLALMAAFIAGIRLVRVEPEEITRQSPRVRAALADSIAIAKALLQFKELQ